MGAEVGAIGTRDLVGRKKNVLEEIGCLCCTLVRCKAEHMVLRWGFDRSLQNSSTFVEPQLLRCLEHESCEKNKDQIIIHNWHGLSRPGGPNESHILHS